MEGMVPDIDRGFGREPFADMMEENKDGIHPNRALFVFLITTACVSPDSWITLCQIPM